MEWYIVVKYAVLIIFLGIFTYMDIKCRVIDNKILLLFLGATVIIVGMNVNIQNYVEAVLGVVFSALFFGIVYFFSKNGIGAGDVKLAVCMGFYLGLYRFINVMIYSLILTVLFGLAVMLIKHKDKKSRLPFAPFLLSGVLCDILLNNLLV